MAFNAVWVCSVMFCLLLHGKSAHSTSCKENPSVEVKIAYSYVSEFNLIWNDKESRADKDVSIWQPVPQEDGFYPLGDFAHSSHEKPEKPSLTVKAIEPGALAAPKSVTFMWSDKGSKAKRDVQIYRLDPKEGYTCLGHVAHNSYVGKPDLRKYRCVKTGYLKRGNYLQIWKDKGSGAKEDIGLWAGTSLDIEKGIDANVFTSIKSHKFPGESPHILNSDYAKHVSFVSAFTAKMPALTAYEPYVNDGKDAELFWSDKGSGAKEDFSLWRPRGVQHYYNLGDYPVSGYDKPTYGMYVFRANKGNVLTSPSYYNKMWNDYGSGADKDVSFWEPICPNGYISTGLMASDSHNNAPSKDATKCLKCDYIIDTGKWKFIWNDFRSGAKSDVTVYRRDGIVPYSMGVHNNVEAYGIKASEIHYINKPADHFIVSNVKYQFDVNFDFGRQQYQMQEITLYNHDSFAKTIAKTISSSYMERRRWDHDSDLESSLHTEVVAGIPTVSDGRITVSAEEKHKTQSRKSGYYKTSNENEASAVVQPKSMRSVAVVATLYKIEVPYTCSVKTVYKDKSVEHRNGVNGVYHGLYFDRDSFKLVYGPDVLPGRKCNF